MDDKEYNALHAIRVAENALKEGNIEKARRLLQKSLRIYATDRAQELLDALESTTAGAQNGKSGFGSPNAHDESLGSPHRTANGSAARSRGPSPARPEYTSEQAEAVKRISKCKNYYEVLEVPREKFSDAELKKKYRKLALLVHPDKNCAPGAAEAFKKVGNAYGVLADSRKRTEYNTNLDRPSSTRSNSSDYTTHFETSADISPEDLFSAFFSNMSGTSFVFDGGIHRRRRQAYQRHHNQQQESEHSQTSFLLQMLPIIVLMGMSLLSSFIGQDPSFSLIRTGKYPNERMTAKLKVLYYVQDGFARDLNAHSIQRIEDQIEAEHITNLRHGCFRERQNRDALLWRARHTGNEDWAVRARQIGVPSCDRLSELHGRV